MDASRAREQLRRRFHFSPDAEASPNREGYAGPEASTAVKKKEKPLPRLNIHSGFWILASIVVTYYVDFFNTVKEHFPTSRWFLVGSALLLISLSIAFYCILYLEWYHGIEDYDVRYPTLIPITTAAFIVAGICLVVEDVASLTPADIITVLFRLVVEDVASLAPAGIITTLFCFNIAFWPVWSLFTPLLLFTQFMGVMMLISLLG